MVVQVKKDETIKEDFLKWSNCNHETSLGLYRRRYDEYKMYSNADYTGLIENLNKTRSSGRELFLPDFFIKIYR